eukprot:jgi/Bigna1/128169/aug1.6_g2877
MAGFILNRLAKPILLEHFEPGFSGPKVSTMQGKIEVEDLTFKKSFLKELSNDLPANIKAGHIDKLVATVNYSALISSRNGKDPVQIDMANVRLMLGSSDCDDSKDMAMKKIPEALTAYYARLKCAFYSGMILIMVLSTIITIPILLPSAISVFRSEQSTKYISSLVAKRVAFNFDSIYKVSEMAAGGLAMAQDFFFERLQLCTSSSSTFLGDRFSIPNFMSWQSPPAQNWYADVTFKFLKQQQESLVALFVTLLVALASFLLYRVGMNRREIPVIRKQYTEDEKP